VSPGAADSQIRKGHHGHCLGAVNGKRARADERLGGQVGGQAEVGRWEGGRIRRCQGRNGLPPVLADEPDVLQNGLQGRHTHRGARSEGGPTKGPALQAAHKGYADAFQACLSTCFKAGQSAVSAHRWCLSTAQKLVTVPARGLQSVRGRLAPSVLAGKWATGRRIDHAAP
jgi:hypothetical protein